MDPMMTQSAYKSPKAERKALASYDKVLTHWPIVYENSLFKTSFGDTYVMLSGSQDSKPLVLLHGGGGNSSMWFYNIEALSKHFRIYAIDIIGEAGKSAGTRPSINEYSLWLKDVFEALNLNKASVCGASSGGTVAHQFALQYPQFINSLILLAPPSLAKMRLSFILRAILANIIPGAFFTRSFLKYMSSRYTEYPDWLIDAFVIQFQAYKPNTIEIPILSNDKLANFLLIH
jgi:pimeloyl-ACP methyl ester carboxylesterase